jgi:hypothetical protein
MLNIQYLSPLNSMKALSKKPTYHMDYRQTLSLSRLIHSMSQSCGRPFGLILWFFFLVTYFYGFCVVALEKYRALRSKIVFFLFFLFIHYRGCLVDRPA